MGDAQNTGNVGDVEVLTPETVKDLSLMDVYPVGRMIATPVASGDLAIAAAEAGTTYVIDLDAKKVLVAHDGGTGTIHATPVIGTVTVPDGQGGTREEERVYISAARGLWCLNLDGIRADKENLENDLGTDYVCEGAAYPLSLLTHGTAVEFEAVDGSALFSRDQRILVHDQRVAAAGNSVVVNGEVEIRDVLYQPLGAFESIGGQVWAIDAYSGETLWIWAPPNPLVQSSMWSSMSMNRDKTIVYITTSNLSLFVSASHVTGNLGGGRAESTVAISALTGDEVWFRQHRLFDRGYEDLDIGNGPTVADVEGEDGCHVVVVPDKDGCIYAYDQEADIPQVGDPDYDRVRPGQQRLLWRQCFMVSDLTTAFDCMTASFDGRRVFAQAAGNYRSGDDANAFALDACTGELQWTSSSIGSGRYDGAVASGMFVQMSGISGFTGGGDGWLQAVNAADGANLATAPITSAAGGGGGASILPDGRILVPSNGGLAVFAVVPGSNASPPASRGDNSFAGPYPEPTSTTSADMERDLRTVLDAAGVDAPNP